MGKRKWISRYVGRFIYLKYLTNIVSQANGGIEQAVLDAYCWMYSTWNIPQVSIKFTNWRVGRKRFGDVKLKVDFQEYKGACTGGDQVLDNMLNQGQSGTHSQVWKRSKKNIIFLSLRLMHYRQIYWFQFYELFSVGLILYLRWGLCCPICS